MTCAASVVGEEPVTAIGARPGRAIVVKDEHGFLSDFRAMSKADRKKAIEAFAEYVADTVPVKGNMRGSAEYRKLLVKVLTRRAWEAVGGMKNEN